MKRGCRHSTGDPRENGIDDLRCAAIDDPAPEASRQGIEHLSFADASLPIVAIDLLTAVAPRQRAVLLPPTKVLDQALIRRADPRQRHERHWQVVKGAASAHIEP